MIDLTRRPVHVDSRSISPENLTGGKGEGSKITVEEGTQGREAMELGLGWKTNPFVIIKPGEDFVLGEIDGMGVIEHLWMTPAGGGDQAWRNAILRMYWEGQDTPSVEAPISDFFCLGWQYPHQVSSLKVCVNPGSGFNSYFEMPFRKHAKITLENRNDSDMRVYYQIDYLLKAVPEDTLYFHAQFRRAAPVKKGDLYTVLDGVKGEGMFAGMYMLWKTDNGKNNNEWIGEGEFKFYIDGDTEFPTYNGTGLEDYFCGSYNFADWTLKDYRPFTGPYTGMNVIHDSERRHFSTFSMYRWHVNDPIIFHSDLRVTIHVLGWKFVKVYHPETDTWTEERRYLPLDDTVETVAYWYQTLPAASFPALPDAEAIRL